MISAQLELRKKKETYFQDNVVGFQSNLSISTLRSADTNLLLGDLKGPASIVVIIFSPNTALRDVLRTLC